jgi:hypothetical protein
MSNHVLQRPIRFKFIGAIDKFVYFADNTDPIFLGRSGIDDLI